MEQSVIEKKEQNKGDRESHMEEGAFLYMIRLQKHIIALLKLEQNKEGRKTAPDWVGGSDAKQR